MITGAVILGAGVLIGCFMTLLGVAFGKHEDQEN